MPSIEELQSEITSLRSHIADLEARLQGDRFAWPASFQMTYTEHRIAWALYRVRENVCTKEAIYADLYDDREINPDPKIIDVVICKLRKKFLRHGIFIKTVWGRGYQFTPESLPILDAMLASKETTHE